MRKVLSKEKTKCPSCGKKGLLIRYDSGASFCEHSRKKSDIKIMGQYVIDVQGCHIKQAEKRDPQMKVLDDFFGKLVN